MTSLSRQLKSLEPTSQFSSISKQKASLLFSGKAAGDVDRDTIYSISSQALKDLIVQDDKFRPFQATLFSEAMKSQDRNQLNATENNKLDLSISSFLSLLSPIYLQANVFKVLEWLVRRFRINELNLDQIMACILPYHETSQFIRFVSILSIKYQIDHSLRPTSRWTFLQTVQKSKVPISRSILAEICIKDHSLLDFVIQTFMTNKRLGITNYALASFFAYLLIEYFTAITKVTDNHIRQILPVILDGLESVNEDYRSTMQMLIALLAKKVTFEQVMLNVLFEAVSNGSGRDSLYSCLLVIISIAQSQQITSFPMSAMATFLSRGNFERELMRVLENFKADQFVGVFGMALAQAALDKDLIAKSSVIALLRSNSISKENLTLIIGFLMEGESLDDIGVDILKQVHSLRFLQVDGAINEVLENFSGSKKQKKQLYGTMSTIFGGSATETFYAANNTLFLALQHHNPQFRLLAISRLSEVLADSGSDAFKDAMSFIEPILVARLDDEIQITIAVLELPNLVALIKPSTLVLSLTKIIAEMKSHLVVSKAIDVALQLLENEKSVESKDLIPALFGCLLYTCNFMSGKESVQWVTRFLSLIGIKNADRAVASLKNEKGEASTRNVSAILCFLSEICNQLIGSTYDVAFFRNCVRSTNMHARVFSSLVLNKAASDKKLALDDIADYLSVLTPQLSFLEIKAMKFDVQLLHFAEESTGLYLKQAKPLGIMQFEKSLHLISFASLIANCSSSSPPIWTSPDGIYEFTVISMFKAIFLLPMHQSVFIKSLLSTHCSNLTLEFCLSVATSKLSAPLIKCSCLDISMKFIESKSKVAQDYQILIPSLLINLMDESKSVRKKTLDLLQILKTSCMPLFKLKPTPSSIYGYDKFYGLSSSVLQYLDIKAAVRLLETLKERNEEILSDSKYLKLNFNLLLKTLKGEKGNSLQSEAVSFLVSNLLAMTNKLHQTMLLHLLEDVDSPIKLKTLIKLLEFQVKAIRKKGHAEEHELQFVYGLIKCYSITGIKTLFVKSNFLSVLISLISNFETQAEIKISCSSINVITPSFFSSVELSTQQALYSCLIDALALSPAEVRSVIKLCLRSIPLTSEIIAPKLASIRASLDEDETGKRSKIDTNAQQTKLSVLVAFLEFLQFSKAIRGAIHLVPGIVVLLNGLLAFPLSNVEYPKQLILSTLEHIMRNTPEASTLGEDVLRADLIVQCIRVTENPQTHNAALLLLAAIGKTHPQVVLLNIMPVFTFMGANILRQDDSYSFHVVKQTLETIIPSLLADKRNPLTYVKNIMDVFVNALRHIPSHRRLKLFTILITTLGENVYLGSLISLILSYPLIAAGQPILPTEEMNYKKFAIQLLQQFETDVGLRALDSIMKILASLPNEQIALENSSLIDASVLPTRTIRLIKLHLADFISTALKTNLEISGLGHESNQARAELHKNLVQSTLLEIGHTQAMIEQDPSLSKFLKRCLNSLYNNLDAINSILSLPIFLNVVEQLLSGLDSSIKKRAIAILQERIKALDVEEHHITYLDTAAESLAVVLKGKEQDEVSLEIKQHALLCLASMVEHVGKLSLGTYSTIFSCIIGLDGLLHKNVVLSSTALVAMAAFIAVLGPRTVPFISKFIPVVLKKVEDASSRGDDTSKALVKGSLLCLISLIEAIPKFMSSFLPRVIMLVCSSASTLMENEYIAKQISKLRNKLPAQIEHRIMFPALLKEIKALVAMGSSSLLQGLSLLQAIILESKQSSLMEFGKEWTKLFMSLFDCPFQLTLSSFESSRLQDHIISLFAKYTLKMNETKFKPLFMKAVDWGLTKSSNQEERKIFLFKLTNSLLEQLKSIFVPYYGFVLDAAIAVLDESRTLGITPLWSLVVSSIGQCLQYDNSDFVTHERFEKLMSPLVDQLDLVDMHGPAYKDQMTALVIPAIVNLATAKHHEDAWKPLNKAVLMKTRSEDSSVRWAALKVVSGLYSRLGEEMLVFFPETIPFMAEIMEDNDPEVEQLCKKVCMEIQEFLGEPIAPYFTPA